MSEHDCRQHTWTNLGNVLPNVIADWVVYISVVIGMTVTFCKLYRVACVVASDCCRVSARSAWAGFQMVIRVCV